MEKVDDRILSLLDFGMLALIKIGVVAAVLPLVFIGLRIYSHYGYVSAEAEVVRAFTQCEISSDAAQATGKRARWWSCSSANGLQRAFPTVDLGVATVDFAEIQFVLSNGLVQRVKTPRATLAVRDAEPGQIVPISYARSNPWLIKPVLTLADWIILACIGLAGLTISGVAWRSRSKRAAIAARIVEWLRKTYDRAGPETSSSGTTSGASVRPRSRKRRGLGVG